MSLAFEHYTGIKSASLTAQDPVGFVAALNLTFFLAAVLGVVAVATSAARGEERPYGNS
jgi:hypothetical protein